MKYSAIIFDLDGTAIQSAMDAMPSKTMVDTTHEYVNKIKLCAATGRSWIHAEPVVSALRLKQPCIISGGAMIVQPDTKQVLWQETIDSQTAQKILDVTRSFPYPAAVAQNLNTTYNADPKQLAFEGEINTFYILGVPIGQEDEVILRLEAIEGITTSKVHTWNEAGGTDLHVTSDEATKEHAVVELCSLLGVDRENVAGVGDGFNDIHLFRAVGHKIAMGNAVPELKEAADWVIGNVSDDGLAKFIAESA